MPDQRLQSRLYQDDLSYCAALPIDWSRLNGKTIAVSGATGMIGTFLIDVLMRKNAEADFRCDVIAIGRNAERIRARFPYVGGEHFHVAQMDVSVPGACPELPADIVVHLASTTHPRAYATEPVATITSNIIGLKNLLDYARSNDASRHGDGIDFVFASSVEVYGQNRGDVERFDERYCGYIDANTLRAGYPEAKRLGESLCQAYREQYGVRPVIPRIARTYGPTLHADDSKASSQFIHRGLAGEDIILKSEGMQRYSYAYVGDTVTGLLYCVMQGKAGEAYNIADSASDCRLRDLAALVAEYCGVEVRFELPDEVESKGYSKATLALMDGGKLAGLGWKVKYPIRQGIERTLHMMRNAG